MSARLGEQHIGGHVVVVIQQDMHLDTALGAAEAGPGEQRQAESDGGRVQAQQLVLEAKPGRALAETLPPPQAIGQVPEQALEEGRRPVRVGIGQRRTPGRTPNAHVDELADAAGQTVTDLAQGIGVSQVAEQHRHELRPASEALGAFLGVVLPHQLLELPPRYLLQKLTEETRVTYHDLEALLLW